MTTFADGVFQYGGMPVSPGGFAATKLFSSQKSGVQKKGRAWFVDASQGISGDGRTPSTPFSTMQQAFNALASGDIIYFVGNITEQLVTPVQIFDITVVGCGNRPRNADATPAGGNWAAATWRAPSSGGTAAQATVRVLQQGWRFINILFNAIDANAACIELVRNADAGDAERDASHCSILGCRFAGAGIGIRGGVAGLFTELVFNVEVAYCKFNDMTTAMSAAAFVNGWHIHHNNFGPNTSQITMAATNFLIEHNSIGPFTAAGNSGGIDLNGGAGTNQVCWNNLSGTYSIAGGYRVGGAGDNWYGNASSAGFTSADPA